MKNSSFGSTQGTIRDGYGGKRDTKDMVSPYIVTRQRSLTKFSTSPKQLAGLDFFSAKKRDTSYTSTGYLVPFWMDSWFSVKD